MSTTKSTTISKSVPELLTVELITRHVWPVNPRTIHRAIAAGKFPTADVRLSEKQVFWRRSTVERWLSNPEKWKQG